ncbi:MAG: type II toxin-antitoxin system RelE/ParE family toxin [Acidobacteriia bacterium]|nr:type II toxin-antitoxin system RelE/ParE family toxin [Terriglobia bacterium]
MAFRVRFLPRARQDLETIYRRVIQEAPLRGAEWFEGLERSVYSLRYHPERCPIIPELSTATDDVRRLLHGNYPHIYKVYYHLVGQIVEILHIRHGARREPRRETLLK